MNNEDLLNKLKALDEKELDSFLDGSYDDGNSEELEMLYNDLYVLESFLKKWSGSKKQDLIAGDYVTYLKDNCNKGPDWNKLIQFPTLVHVLTRVISLYSSEDQLKAYQGYHPGSLPEQCHCSDKVKLYFQVAEFNFLLKIMHEIYEESSADNPDSFWSIWKSSENLLKGYAEGFLNEKDKALNKVTDARSCLNGISDEISGRLSLSEICAGIAKIIFYLLVLPYGIYKTVDNYSNNRSLFFTAENERRLNEIDDQLYKIEELVKAM